ncbi:MAG TPA: cell division protein ZapA [Candidatus Tectomicrobia bacterium]
MLSRVAIVMLKMQHLRRRGSMSQDKTLMEVSIFGQTLKLRGDANPELTLKLAEFVDQKMRDAVPSTMSLSNVLYNERIARVAILAALNIAEELFQLRADKETEKNLIEEKAGALLSLLEKELQPS